MILAIDQGTTSCRAILYTDKAEAIDIEQMEFTQHFPENGWVEHDPMEIFEKQSLVIEKLLNRHLDNLKSIKAVGITNQRETTVVWDKTTGLPIYNAIVWQDKRTTDFCKSLIEKGKEQEIIEKTGLRIDTYFSASKAHWIMENIVNQYGFKINSQNLLIGTIDTWLIWKFSEGKHFNTDPSNASRTLLFDIHKQAWDKDLCALFGVKPSMLPNVLDNTAHFGDIKVKGQTIPIRGVAGDQQAALFGQTCFTPGDVKNTYGTGCFMLMNTGEKPQTSKHGLLTTIGWRIDGKTNYALEGSVFVAGSAIQWLRDQLDIIDDAADTQKIAEETEDGKNLVVVPAFAGLGAPYWDMDARGAIYGITRDTTDKQIIKATLESLAYQSYDLLESMKKDANTPINSLRVDGGASANRYLMQFQADIINCEIERPADLESTALGVAFMAGIGAGMFTMEDVLQTKNVEATFIPKMEKELRNTKLKYWNKATERTKNWVS